MSAAAAEPEKPARAEPSSRSRARLLFAGKLLVAALLLGWLARSNVLDFSKLGVVLSDRGLFAANLGAWALCSIVFATLRWRLLLTLSGARVGLVRAAMLQLTALFFNLVIPGNVGGDVLKALFVARESKPEARPAILLVVFVERLLGLMGLVGIAGLVLLVVGPPSTGPSTRGVVAAVALLALGFFGGGLGAVVVARVFGGALEQKVAGPSRVRKLLVSLVQAFRLMASRPLVLLAALGLSMANHGTAMLYFTTLTRALTGQPVTFAQIATVFPLGLLSLLLPVSPAGFGVGHMAFERLFEAIGITGGATVFNVFLIGQMTPCLLGILPYLAMRSRSELPTGAPSETDEPGNAGEAAETERSA